MGFQFEFNEFPYTTRDLSDHLDYPKMGRNRLREFLRNEGIFIGDRPADEYMELRYFGYDTLYLPNREFYNRIMVSVEGLNFIEKLVGEKLGPKIPVKNKSFNNKYKKC